ncbi:hypothetical protein OAO87_04215 [bacterium]|nr:hypothetical protein [bacterium]
MHGKGAGRGGGQLRASETAREEHNQVRESSTQCATTATGELGSSHPPQQESHSEAPLAHSNTHP